MSPLLTFDGMGDQEMAIFKPIMRNRVKHIIWNCVLHIADQTCTGQWGVHALPVNNSISCYINKTERSCLRCPESTVNTCNNNCINVVLLRTCHNDQVDDFLNVHSGRTLTCAFCEYLFVHWNSKCYQLCLPSMLILVLGRIELTVARVIAW